MIPAYATVKKAAALVNRAAGRLGDTQTDLIVRVCDEVLAGEHQDQFPLHVWMTGSGTQFNMNVNEVIANRCSQLAGQPLGGHTPVHPNDHVNMSQSSNDSFPTAMNVAAAVGVKQKLMPAVGALRDALDTKARAWADVVKIGRTHLQNATSLTLGQEFSGYVGMLADDLDRLELALRGMYRLALGGTAVGTGLNSLPGFDRDVAAEIARLTGLPFVTAPNKFAVRYRDKVCCYNDHIQGTSRVTLAGLIAALKVTGGKIRDQRILFLGAGSAAVGLAGLIASAMVQEGLSLKEAQAQISMFDVNGLLEPGRTDLFDFQKPYAHPHAPSRDLVACIESIKPTMLIGVSTVGKTFTRPVVEAMSRLNDRPIIFALSNPTEHAECTPEEAYQWSRGKALYAAGVQFPPVSYGGRTFLPGQANNFYIFPAVGMAIHATRPKRVTDEMFVEAAHALADQVTPAELEQGLLFPPQSNILETEIKVAEGVFRTAVRSCRGPRSRAPARPATGRPGVGTRAG
jgi:hypothetical protein